MVSVIILSVIMLNIIILNAVLPSVVILSINMVGVNILWAIMRCVNMERHYAVSFCCVILLSDFMLSGILEFYSECYYAECRGANVLNYL